MILITDAGRDGGMPCFIPVQKLSSVTWEVTIFKELGECSSEWIFSLDSLFFHFIQIFFFQFASISFFSLIFFVFFFCFFHCFEFIHFSVSNRGFRCSETGHLFSSFGSGSKERFRERECCNTTITFTEKQSVVIMIINITLNNRTLLFSLGGDVREQIDVMCIVCVLCYQYVVINV